MLVRVLFANLSGARRPKTGLRGWVRVAVGYMFDVGGLFAGFKSGLRGWVLEAWGRVLGFGSYLLRVVFSVLGAVSHQTHVFSSQKRILRRAWGRQGATRGARGSRGKLTEHRKYTYLRGFRGGLEMCKWQTSSRQVAPERVKCTIS